MEVFVIKTGVTGQIVNDGTDKVKNGLVISGMDDSENSKAFYLHLFPASLTRLIEQLEKIKRDSS